LNREGRQGRKEDAKATRGRRQKLIGSADRPLQHSSAHLRALGVLRGRVLL